MLHILHLSTQNSDVNPFILYFYHLTPGPPSSPLPSVAPKPQTYNPFSFIILTAQKNLGADYLQTPTDNPSNRQNEAP